MSTQNNRPVSDSKLTTVFSERLVPLYDGQAGLRGKMQVEIVEPSDAEGAGKDVGTEADAPAPSGAVRTPRPTFPEVDDSRSYPHGAKRSPQVSSDSKHSSTLDFIVSDETLDRYNEVIVASGW